MTYDPYEEFWDNFKGSEDEDDDEYYDWYEDRVYRDPTYDYPFEWPETD